MNQAEMDALLARMHARHERTPSEWYRSAAAAPEVSTAALVRMEEKPTTLWGKMKAWNEREAERAEARRAARAAYNASPARTNDLLWMLTFLAGMNTIHHWGDQQQTHHHDSSNW